MDTVRKGGGMSEENTAQRNRFKIQMGLTISGESDNNWDRIGENSATKCEHPQHRKKENGKKLVCLECQAIKRREKRKDPAVLKREHDAEVKYRANRKARQEAQ